MTTKKAIKALAAGIGIVWMAAACGGNGNGNIGKGNAGNGGADQDASRKDSAQTAQYYSPPSIPSWMTDPALRTAYYVEHFWEGYALTDTAFVRSGDTEQLYANFLDALQYADTAARHTALHQMMERMEADSAAYRHFCLLAEKYLYHPNSPMRNEDYYIAVLQQMVHSPLLTSVEKLTPADRLKQARKNRPGMRAADFGYVTPQGTAGRLSRISADYILLFFYDPDCSNCRKHEKVFSEIPAFVELQEKGVLRVLAIYPDEDGDEWRRAAPHMPPHWIVGWNRQGDIRRRMLYDIRATPSLYLLDREKRVILKDAEAKEVIGWLARRMK